MDWKATGTIDTEQLDLEDGRDRWSPIGAALTFDPPLAELDVGCSAQADFACNAIGEAKLGGLIDGAYSVAISGRFPDGADTASRKTITIKLTPRAH